MEILTQSIPVITGGIIIMIIQAVKVAQILPKRFIPLLTIVLGLIAGAGISKLYGLNPVQTTIEIIAVPTALYEQFKNIVKNF